MAEQIEEVFVKYEEVFEGRGEPLKKYILKNYIKPFSQHEIIDVRRDDATNRLKSSGFQKYLSSWRNYYENITISSCIKIGGKEVRYDYRFMFTEEKLNEDAIKTIEDGLKEISNLRLSFKFKDALAKVDKMLDLIKGEDDRIFNRRLLKVRKDIIEAEELFIINNAKLEALEKEFAKHKENNDLKEMARGCEEIIIVSKDLKKRNITKKYTDILKDLEAQLAFEKELSKLEKRHELNRKRNNLDDARLICEEILFKAKPKKRIEIIKKYEDILREIHEEIQEIIGKCDKVIADSIELRDKKIYDKPISLLTSMIEYVQKYKAQELDEYLKTLQETREIVLIAQDNYLQTEQNLVDLENKLNEALEKRQIFLAKNYCEALIAITKKDKKDELADKYSKVLNQIHIKIEELKNKIDGVINESSKFAEGFHFEDSLKNLDLMLQFIAQDLPEYKKKLEDKRKEIIDAEEDYRELEDEISELDNILQEYLKQKNYIAALGVCEKIIELTETTNNPELIEKYKEILDDINRKIDEIKGNIAFVLKESERLMENNLFKEALTGIDDILEIIRGQELPDEIKKLKNQRAILVEAQEKYIKFADDITELDKRLGDNLVNNNLIAALSDCDLLMQIAESSNEQKLINRYEKILEEISKKVYDIKERVDIVLFDATEQMKNHSFDDSLANLDTMLDFLKDYDFPDLIRQLESKKREVLEAQSKQGKVKDLLTDLDKTLEKNLKIEDLTAALANVESLIELAKKARNAKLINKYTDILNNLNKKIGDINDDIEDALKESSELGQELNFDDALGKLDDMLKMIDGKNLPDQKKKLEAKRDELLGIQDKYSQAFEDIEKLKQKIQNLRDKKDFDAAIEACDEIIEMAKSIGKYDLEKEYTKIKRDIEADKERESIREKLRFKTTKTQKQITITGIDEILNKYIDFLIKEFQLMKEKLFLNLENLRLGGIRPYLEKAIDMIFEQGLNNAVENLKEALKDYIK